MVNRNQIYSIVLLLRLGNLIVYPCAMETDLRLMMNKIMMKYRPVYKFIALPKAVIAFILLKHKLMK